MLLPKSVNNIFIREIIVVFFYSPPPKSNKKSKLVDSILTTTHMLLTEYPTAALIIGEDKNDLDITPLIAGLPGAPLDKPFITREMKILDRRKKRQYFKKGKSEKYIKLKIKYDFKLKKAAEHYLDKKYQKFEAR